MKKPVKKACTFALLILVSSLMTSCVYLRLNTLRKHLSQFETFCSFENKDGPSILFKQPVVKKSDTEWLFGFPPSEIKVVTDPSGDQHTWTFEKIWPDAQKNNEPDFNIVIQCDFNEEGRMNRLCFPDGMAGVLDEQVVDQLFRNAKDAKVEKSETQSSWGMSQHAQFASRDKIVAVSGRPFARSIADGKETLVYKYHLAGQETPADQIDGEGSLVFDNTSGKMTDANIFMGKLHIAILSRSDGSYDVKIKKSRS